MTTQRPDMVPKLPHDKPLPDVTGIDAPFWEGTMAGELRLQRCRECGTCWHPANDFCPSCLGHNFEWTAASGNGTIAGRTFLHQTHHRPLAPGVPHNVAWVELDEGPMVTANIVGAVKHDIEVGRRVRVVFERVTPEVTVPRFRLADVTPGE
jgi:hypothetical protein